MNCYHKYIKYKWNLNLVDNEDPWWKRTHFGLVWKKNQTGKIASKTRSYVNDSNSAWPSHFLQIPHDDVLRANRKGLHIKWHISFGFKYKFHFNQLSFKERMVTWNITVIMRCKRPPWRKRDVHRRYTWSGFSGSANEIIPQMSLRQET